MESEYSQPFAILNEALNNFIQAVNNQDVNRMGTSEWTVRDILSHVVYWHCYYAQQYTALAKGEKPIIFTSAGGSTRNKEGVDSLKKKSTNELLLMLETAQSELYESIVLKHVPAMSYTNRRKYRTEEFLDVVTKHIRRHTEQIVKAKTVLN